jgi:uncharacterized membrane protein YkoI
MMKTLKWWAVGVALALVAMAASGTVVLAHDDNDNDGVNQALAAQLVQRGEILSLQQILSDIPPKYQGKILKSELDNERNRYIYEVETQDDQTGIVWELEFDAKTGELLKVKQDD